MEGSEELQGTGEVVKVLSVGLQHDLTTDAIVEVLRGS